MALDLVYRPFVDADLGGLEVLWQQSTMWGRLTPQIWQDYVVNAPLGPPAGLLAVDQGNGEIVGQFPFLRARVQIDGEIRSAFRPAAPIVNKRITGMLGLGNPLSHPIAQMFRRSVEALRQDGAALLWMVPDPRWRPILQLIPGLRTTKVPLYSRTLPLVAPVESQAGYETEVLSTFDERLDRLWLDAGRLHPVSLIRNAAAMKFRVGRGDWEVLSVTRHGELVGVVASKLKGDRQWLIGEVVTADLGPALRATLAAVIQLAHERAQAAAAGAIHKVSLAVSPAMQPAVTAMGFVRDRYDFPLVVQRLDSALPADVVAPERWYISAND